MSKIALVIGHNVRSQGAVRVTDKRTGYDINGDLAVAIRDLDPARYVIVRRTAGTGEIGRAYAEVDRLGILVSVALHFNRTKAVSATGTETLTSGTTNSARLARGVQAGMVRALGLRDRGVKVIARNGRGGASLWTGKPPAFFIEPYFGSNAGDCAAADRNFSALVRAIHEACPA
ncbi:N-acetylmuramoyl-L-alanine amidase [Rhodobacter sp. 24-YEA-8]|uniref:N-acetylmuramoyl-L-alanine amidase n=1 Tax=Rhodobacter sp. 24-YEA-8 TaxID=1884310 RepID=UPI000898F0F3|nr:N-acetylmuramoyl-L-alanine amidase [Rhodobacter sp. 24-YEA-8]SEB69951.1 N-acetylmuramoyl-L-alanine amidase [Rhodobacter sp. 24-YEA-8]